MSKPNSGLFENTKGHKAYSSSGHKLSPAQIKSQSQKRVKNWARKKQSELTGKAKKNFNTACVAYDEKTGKFYFGRNGGYNKEGYVKNPTLYGDSSHKGLLPATSLNKYPVGNCAEVDAVNRALNAGAKISDLHLTTIHVTKNSFDAHKASCENCTYAFKGKIKKNYSGWTE